MDPLTAAAAIQFVGQMDTNATSASNAAALNAFNADEAAKNREFQERMSNTAYQRQVADLSAAGLNPMLAYIKGGGASTPVGSQASGTAANYTSPADTVARTRLTAAQTLNTITNTGNIEADTALKLAQTGKTEADTTLVNAMVSKTNAEINKITIDSDKARAEIHEVMSRIDLNEAQAENLVLERGRIRAAIDNLQASSSLMAKQGMSEIARKNNLEAAIGEIEAKSDMAKAAYKAMQDTNFAGVLAREVKPVSDIASEWIDKLLPWNRGKSTSEEHTDIVRDPQGREVGRSTYRRKN